MLRQAAIKYADRGKPVFPCRPDKAPYTARGFKDATTHPGRINAFWNRYPDAKIGMPAGKGSGVFVIDVDRLDALGELPRELPETLTIRTGSGGLHYYFNHVAGITNSRGVLPLGIDVRGEGGYVIVPPSEGYSVEHRAPIADAPEWLLSTLREEPRKPSGPGRSQRERIPDEGESIPEGRRDETLASIAGRLHDGTRDLAQLEADLQDINEARCNPPLPVDQVRRIARSIFRYEPCRPARPSPTPETASALAEIEASILRREWKGKGGKTRYSIAVSALKIARQFGARVEGGVRVEVSARQLALAAATSRSSIMRNLKKMGDILRPDNECVSEGKAGAIVLLTPPARTNTTLTTERVVSTDEGGCVSSRSPLSAPRLRWSSPAFKPRRGLVRGTSKVRNGPVPEKRAAVIRLGKSCERVMDSLEASGGSMTLSALASAVDVKRPRDLTRRKNLETGKGRDGFVTRLVEVGVVEVAGDTVILASDWLAALGRERDRAGEIELYKRDMRRYNDQSKAYRNRNKVKADPAPFQEEMQEVRESYPQRRREAITTALARLFAERPEYRGRRAGQVACQLPWYLPADFPPGAAGAPKDHEIENILDGEAVA
ncbi:MAG: bifunctional DNA primase/polymerase [Actinobacteria bacterium]|nr:bifunctional DNA primase/polymerase [Actinomycetota bacterium]MCA1739647.1 bifunctional DNA primase/polymerase [Actinomycetota bacterium]